MAPPKTDPVIEGLRKQFVAIMEEARQTPPSFSTEIINAWNKVREAMFWYSEHQSLKPERDEIIKEAEKKSKKDSPILTK